MKTKLLALLFAMVLVVSLLASCKTDPTDDDDDDDDDDYVPVAGAPVYNVTWDRTELKYALTNNSQYNELDSGCERYYSGSTTGGAVEKIDDLVSDRNFAAARAANVTVRFDYTTAVAAWGGNIETIVSNSLTSSSASPDIYANFVYDITCAQLRGCFANLLREDKTNWFRFTEDSYNPASDNYFDSKAGEGYFYEYMKSLSLSDDKIFVLASNYCTDLVRSFVVSPMNVEQMSTLVGGSGTNNKSYTGDMQQVSDFYDLVWRTPEKAAVNDKYKEGFTYDVVAHYASKFYSQADDSDVLSGKSAFVAGTTSGIPSSGLLYTSSVVIIDKIPNGDGTYTYDYPENNTALDAFATKLTELFQNRDGVFTVNRADFGIDPGNTEDSELIRIRTAFAEGRILFGGLIMVGSLDNNEYQRMRVEGKAMGFGVLPVPLYRAYADEAKTQPEEYKTLVHNLAKVIAISKTSQNFTQCTAYLDYLSRMSQEVLDEYYEVKLTSAVGGMAAVYNEQMLTYIRNHVRNCFDKTYEDAVANLMSATNSAVASAGKYHEIMARNDFVVPTLSNDYKAYAPAKEEQLKLTVATWNALSN